jgi:hypothetical protein
MQVLVTTHWHSSIPPYVEFTAYVPASPKERAGPLRAGKWNVKVVLHRICYSQPFPLEGTELAARLVWENDVADFNPRKLPLREVSSEPQLVHLRL